MQIPGVSEVFPPRPQPSSGVGFLAAVGLAASWVAAVALAESAGPDFVINFEVRPPLFHPAHGLALLSVTAAGMLAALRGRFRLLTIEGRIALVVSVAGAAVWAASSYTLEELLSPVIFGATGPFVWFTLVFVLVGTEHRVWVVIDPVIRLLAYATSGLALWTLVHSASSTYVAGFTKHTQYSILLMWLGGWTLLSATRLRGWRLVARATPFVVLILTAIYSQARSWTILALLLGATFVFLRAREQGSTLGGARTVVMICVLAVVAGAIASRTILSGTIEGFANRFDDDTRSMQYLDFFSVVPVSDLLLGRGPKGTWYWYGVGDYQYFDNGLLWMLFVGGVPTLLSYVAIVVWPAIRAFRKNLRGQDAAAVCLVLFWGVALTGFSTYTLPSVAISSYLVSLWAGRCYLILAESDLRTERIRRGHLLRSWPPYRRPEAANAGR